MPGDDHLARRRGLSRPGSAGVPGPPTSRATPSTRVR
jgi:hypothetical protein